MSSEAQHLDQKTAAIGENLRADVRLLVKKRQQHVSAAIDQRGLMNWTTRSR